MSSARPNSSPRSGSCCSRLPSAVHFPGGAGKISPGIDEGGSVPWCHTCSIEYPVDLDECPECGHQLVDAPALERRIYAGASAGLVTVAILPPEQAFVASQPLDQGGIP